MFVLLHNANDKKRTSVHITVKNHTHTFLSKTSLSLQKKKKHQTFNLSHFLVNISKHSKKQDAFT